MKYAPVTVLDVVSEGFSRNRSGIFAAVKRNGTWLETTIDEARQKIRNLTMGLFELGVRRGDKVSIHAENSTEWLIVDQAVLTLGAALVPIYTTQPGNQIEYILENSEAKIHIFSNDELFADTQPFINSIETVQHVISITGSVHKDVKNLEQVLQLGQKKYEQEPDLYEKFREEIMPDDLATLIYTSGTTGTPKGVMLTHNNIGSNILAAQEIFPIDPTQQDDMKTLSYLPLAHMFERIASYIYCYLGVPVYYIEDVSEIKDDFMHVKPVYLVTVPRLLEKIVTGIKVKGQEFSGIKKRLYYWAVNLAENYDPENPPAGWKMKLADKLVYKKVRELFGGNLIGMNVGGAALAPNIARFINGIGIYCGLGYGLTETSPVLTGPPIGELRIGSSGKPITDVHIKIAEDGEILAKGPNIMKGYYKMPEQTAEVIKDGWFYTGDIGHIDKDGWLFVTDRKKDLFKLSTGKYVAPQPIENALASSGFIEQAIVLGSEEKFCSALIVPNWDNLKKRFESQGYNFPETDKTTNEYVLKRIQKEVDKVNADLPHWEQVKKFALLEEQFTIEKGEITPTLKMKRNVIRENYKEQITGIYRED